MPLLQEALGRAVLLIMRHPGSGGSLGFGFLPKGQTGGKDDKMGFFFFFFPNRPQQFAGTQRHTKHCLPFITQGRRLKAQRGGEGEHTQSTTGVIAAGFLQQKDPANVSYIAQRGSCSAPRETEARHRLAGSPTAQQVEVTFRGSKPWQCGPKTFMFKRKQKTLDAFHLKKKIKYQSGSKLFSKVTRKHKNSKQRRSGSGLSE